MVQALTYLRESPSQTAGPYVHIGCVPNHAGVTGVFPTDLGASMLSDQVQGQRITVIGTVYDGLGAPLRDAMVEIWQADAAGLYPGDPRGPPDPAFAGWGRAASDGETGQFRFDTIKPGPVPHPGGGLQAPHLSVWIVARGINTGLWTRMYFPDADNAQDPILTRIEHQSRVPTLIALREGPHHYRFDVRLQGPDETVFFDF